MKIEQIKLLRGCHDDTATTNPWPVVATFLNADPVTDDYSESVCVAARAMFGFLTDLATDKQRKTLLPFLLRAIHSAADDGQTTINRLDLLIEFAHAQIEIFSDMKKNKVSGTFEQALHAARLSRHKCPETRADIGGSNAK